VCVGKLSAYYCYYIYAKVRALVKAYSVIFIKYKCSVEYDTVVDTMYCGYNWPNSFYRTGILHV